MKISRFLPFRLILPLTALLAARAGLPGRAETAVRIALLSDPHTTRGTKEDQPLYRRRFDETIAQVNAAKVEVDLIAGDLTQGGAAEEVLDFKAEAARLTAPVLWVPGNHDVGAKRLPNEAGGITAARLAKYEADLGPSFFARTIAGVRFIGLNGSLFGSGLPREAAMWQLLETEMAHPNPPRTVVFLHYPPFVQSADEKGGGYWNLEPAPRRRLLALLERGGVRVLLTGHLHYQLVNHYHGMLIVTTGPVSFGLPRGVAPEGWTLVTLPAHGEPRAEFQRVE